MARPTWKGWLGFGLVNIPVQLFKATRSQAVSFHLLHEADGARVRQKRVCSADGEEVGWDEIVKGYEVTKGQHVIVTDEELETFALKPSRSIEIEDFVELDEIDPVYFAGSDYLVPQAESAKAYALLASVLESQGKAGIARMILRSKESLVLVRAEGGRLLLTSLYRADEVIPFEPLWPEVPEPKVDERERKMAVQLVESMTAPFEPEKFPDETRARLKELLRAKAEGEELVAAPEAPLPPKVVNLMDALQKSLAAREETERPRSGRRVAASAARTVRERASSEAAAEGGAKTKKKRSTKGAGASRSSSKRSSPKKKSSK